MPHWWNLWSYHHLRTQERREVAIRAAEREELVYGITLAMHNPAGLADWRRGLRDNAGLLQAPQTAKDRALQMVVKLRDAVWAPFGEPPVPPQK